MNAADTGDDLVVAVRVGDYERFLAIQLAPAAKRPALYAIAAFHIEIASIAEIVSEALIGHIRFAWWREALEEIETGLVPRNHPVVLALAEMHRAHPRVMPFLYEMIDARAADVDETLIADEAAWREYCNHTAGALHMAFAFVVDEACARANETQIRDQGKAYAMIGLARAIPFMAAQGWMRFPQVRLAKHQLTSLAPSNALNDLVRELIEEVAPLVHTSARNQKLLLLNALVVLSRLSERQLKRITYDPYRLRPAKLRAVWQMIYLKYCPFTCFLTGR